MTSDDIQDLMRRVRKAQGMLKVMQQSPSDNYHWSAEVAGYSREDFEDLLALAAIGASVREQAYEIARNDLERRAQAQERAS